MRRLPRLAAAFLILLAFPAAAQQRTADSRPDLSGFWSPSFRPGPPDPALLATLPPDTALINDTGALELPKHDYGGLKPRPEALAKAEKWDPLQDMTVSRACLPPSIVYATQGPFPIEIHQGRDLIVIKHEYFDQVRIVSLDGRGHRPADAPHSKVGDSIGHWEGDELVVDTTHLSASTILNNGLDHSDKVHMVERFRLSPDGKTLMLMQWFEDPETLENNGARYIVWTRQPGQYVFPYECDPSFGANYAK